MPDDKNRSVPPPDVRNRSMPPPDGMPPATFAYLQQSFGALSGQMADATALARDALNISRENKKELAAFKWHVFGPSGMPFDVSISHPPPPESTVIGRVQTAEHDVDAARARELLLAADVATLKNHIKAQSNAMGVVAPDVTPGGFEVEPPPSGRKALAAFLHSRAGRDFVIRVVTLVLAAVTTIATTYLATRTTPPPPPAPTSPLLPVPG